MKGLKLFWVASLAFLCVGLPACTKSTEVMTSEPSVQNAVCMMYPTEGNSAKGKVTFTKVSSGVQVVAELDGLAPGDHGFHIHEYGDCSAADGTSAGGHFNPEAMPHAGPMDMQRHEGDMGNIVADSLGHAHLEFTDSKMSMAGSNSILGRALVLHKDMDDLKSQPSGNAGPRIACGVIGVGK